MRSEFDWKFYATLALGLLSLLASIAIPFIAWKADLQSKSIRVRVLSSVSLQPTLPSVADIQITVNGQSVEHAYVTSLEISNDGAKPIPAADFESDLLVEFGKNLSIVRIQPEEKNPSNLPTMFNSKGDALSLQPLLLNPGDTVKINVISSGGEPSVKAFGRIAGVSEVRLEEKLPKVEAAARALKVIGFVFALAAYTLAFMPLLRTSWDRISARIASVICAGMSAGMLANSLALDFFPDFSPPRYLLWPALIVLILLSWFAFSLFRNIVQQAKLRGSK